MRTFSQINRLRCESPEAFNMPLDQQSPYHFALGLCEEAGEVGGVIKKIQRGFNERERMKLIKNMPIEDQKLDWKEEELEGLWLGLKKQQLAKELADAFSYIDLIAHQFDIDLPHAIIDKFNQVTKESKYPEEKFYVPHNTPIF